MGVEKRYAYVLWIVLGFFLLDPGYSRAADQPRPKAPNPQELARGRWLYEANCAICHGVRGDGRGMAAHMFVTQPRDFTKGIFEFRSTPSGSLPTDGDLIRTITHGLRGTPMLAQPQLTQGQLRAVIAYIETFSERFSKESAASAIAITEAPSRTAGLLAEGKKIYQDAGCDTCHGPKGTGDGPSAGDLEDYRGYSIRPSDLTRPLKRGSTARSTYQTLITGLDGTPMPSYHGALTEEQLWAVSFYVASLNTGVPSLQQRREEMLGQHVLMMRGGMMHGPPWRMR